MAIKAQAPVVPVACTAPPTRCRAEVLGEARVVRIVVGPPIPTEGLTVDDRDRLTTAVRDRMQDMLAD